MMSLCVENYLGSWEMNVFMTNVCLCEMYVYLICYVYVKDVNKRCLQKVFLEMFPQNHAKSFDLRFKFSTSKF